MILYVRIWNVRVEKILRYEIESNFLPDKLLFFYFLFFILLLFYFFTFLFVGFVFTRILRGMYARVEVLSY